MNRPTFLLRIPSKARLLSVIYFPWIIAECLSFLPIISYITSWFGSFIIFYITLVSPLKYHSIDLPLRYQILRPIALIQLVFAGFMCCTSIFYFLDHLTNTPSMHLFIRDFQADEQTGLIAKAQRINILAHATFVTGIVLCIRLLPPIIYKLPEKKQAFLFQLCILTYLTSVFISYIPGLIQFKYMLLSITVGTSAYILVKGITQKNLKLLAFGGCVFGFNFFNATLTGYKESIIVNTIMLAFLAFPVYKRTVLLLCVPCSVLLLYILPTFTNIIRIQSWIQGQPTEVAREKAYQTFLNDENDRQIDENNWAFLTKRLSETEMFTTYLRKVPEEHSYYGFDILINSVYALIPRVIWDNKPDTEKLAMERVYESGVAQRSSPVSAKTRPVIDAYLSAGVPGVFMYMLFLGMLTQTICNSAEKLCGGYQLGCILIFNTIFQSLWRGNTLEFLLNNILYGYLLMLFIHFILIQTKSLVKHNENPAYNSFL